MAIRRDHRMGMSLRALQRTHNVTWRTVRRALDGQWPEPRKKQRRNEPRLDRYKPLIDGMLRADLDAPPKQRHTAQRIYDRTVESHRADDISYSMVRVYVKDRRKEFRRQAGVGPEAMFVPQTHLPGAEAEVDFGEVHVVLAGKMIRVYLFSLRLSYSGKAVHRVFASCSQEAFFEGHVHAFRVLGGISRGRIRYDNLRAAVERVLGLGRARVENDRWTAFRSHWGIDAFYCRPGIEGAHEEGGVEGQIGYYHRNHFVPVPSLNFAACDSRVVRRSAIDGVSGPIRRRLPRLMLAPAPD
ncbi:IS21 family transposase [Streptomyces sp. NPDC046942]|uniref:IS21 family transposase n=1 Tax=Streptomyces sp. NPDC046942 TaxID=3155137 RepID=UPI003406B59A